MNVVCTIDENYIQHCAVMLQSLRISNPQVHLKVYIIHNGFKHESKNIMWKFLHSLGIEIIFIEIDDTYVENWPITHHVSLATYYRLFITEVLPMDITKVLFLDSDIVIRKSIEELWEKNISKFSHAAVEDPNAAEDKDRLGIPADKAYFNAGVLLINLNFWREEKIFSRAFDLLAQDSDKIKWWDQDILNCLLQDYWLPIDPIWNSHGALLHDSFSKCPQASHPSYLRAISDPAIVHFSGAGRCKPWHTLCVHPFTQEYRKNLSQTPWATEFPMPQPI